MVNTIQPKSEKNQAQLCLDGQQSRQDVEREFQESREAIFESSTPLERNDAIARNGKAREILILNFGYTLEDLARLVDEYGGDAA